jgi:microsomal epoxide hydrolase
MPKPEVDSSVKLTAAEEKGLERMNNFNYFGSSYAREHGLRPGTIGVVLSSSPIGLLAWYVCFATTLTLPYA